MCMLQGEGNEGRVLKEREVREEKCEERREGKELRVREMRVEW